jgi:hypothetical protein
MLTDPCRLEHEGSDASGDEAWDWLEGVVRAQSQMASPGLVK